MSHLVGQTAMSHLVGQIAMSHLVLCLMSSYSKCGASFQAIASVVVCSCACATAVWYAPAPVPLPVWRLYLLYLWQHMLLSCFSCTIWCCVPKHRDVCAHLNSHRRRRRVRQISRDEALSIMPAASMSQSVFLRSVAASNLLLHVSLRSP